MLPPLLFPWPRSGHFFHSRIATDCVLVYEVLMKDLQSGISWFEEIESHSFRMCKATLCWQIESSNFDLIIHSFIFIPAFPLGRVAGLEGTNTRTRNTSRFSAISNSSAGSTPRRNQEPRHLVLGRPLGHFSVGAASRICFADLSSGILVAWPNQRS